MTAPIEILANRRASLPTQKTPKNSAEGVSVFILPSDIPVCLTLNDISILRQVFTQQHAYGLWCGLTLLGEEHDPETGQTERASRAVLFTFGTRQPYFNLTRQLDKTYVLKDRTGHVLKQSNTLQSLLSIFAAKLPAYH